MLCKKKIGCRVRNPLSRNTRIRITVYNIGDVMCRNEVHRSIECECVENTFQTKKNQIMFLL